MPHIAYFPDPQLHHQTSLGGWTEMMDKHCVVEFLDLLDRDIDRNPNRVVFATKAFADFLERLTAGVPVDYDSPIDGDFEI